MLWRAVVQSSTVELLTNSPRRFSLSGGGGGGDRPIRGGEGVGGEGRAVGPKTKLLGHLSPKGTIREPEGTGQLSPQPPLPP